MTMSYCLPVIWPMLLSLLLTIESKSYIEACEITLHTAMRLRETTMILTVMKKSFKQQ